MSYPTSSSASDVWSLRDVYKAEAGDDWPSVSLPLPENTWVLDEGLENIYNLYFGGTAYSGAGITQANVETIFNDTNFQDVNASDRTLAYMNIAANSGEFITISYNAPGTTQVSLYLQRWSGIDVDFTVSGDVSFSNSIGTGGAIFNSAAPESGTFTITTNNDTAGLTIWSISFNGVTPGNLTYG